MTEEKFIPKKDFKEDLTQTYLLGKENFQNPESPIVKHETLCNKLFAMELAPSIDMSNVRAEDRPYVHEVVQYLRQNGLRPELKGSALMGNMYGDIDILATGSLEDLTNVTRALNGAQDIANPFYSTAADGEEYTVAHEGENVAYMHENLAQLFNILVGDTKIHLGLKGSGVIGS
ncbi:hypothetical protein KY346_06485 [Candidatus Woesearchaeota archaeon]|nr:hypothetical protein [Candidatus Woesearchaeota archaeon]